jgi:hypothetical protein
MALLPCSKCSRHVRETDVTCPFCGATALVAARALGPMPADRRFARAAISFAAASALVACGKTNAPEPEPTVTVYGPPPMALDAGNLAIPDAGVDNGLRSAPAYGAPPPLPPEPAATDAGAPSKSPTKKK